MLHSYVQMLKKFGLPVFAVVTLVLVGTCEIKIDISSCGFCKDMILLSNLLVLTFLCICHTNYFT